MPRQRSYHRWIYVAGAVLLPVVLLAPLRVLGVLAVAARLRWWLLSSRVGETGQS